jgi:hypothetical protein
MLTIGSGSSLFKKGGQFLYNTYTHPPGACTSMRHISPSYDLDAVVENYSFLRKVYGESS